MMIAAVTTIKIKQFFLVFDPKLGVISTDEYDGSIEIYIKHI